MSHGLMVFFSKQFESTSFWFRVVAYEYLFNTLRGTVPYTGSLVVPHIFSYCSRTMNALKIPYMLF
jgi:hypothetical protein